MNRLRGAAFVATGLLMGVTAFVFPGHHAARPPQGIFGGIRPDVRPTKRLDFGLSLVEGMMTTCRKPYSRRLTLRGDRWFLDAAERERQLLVAPAADGNRRECGF